MSEPVKTETSDEKRAWEPPVMWQFEMAETEFGFNPQNPGDAGLNGCS